MFKRTWIITGEITRDDLEWVLRSKLDFKQGKPLTEDTVFHLKRELGDVAWYWDEVFNALNLDPSQITTTNEKEVTWLKLYFANRVILIAEEVTSYKYEQCYKGETKWHRLN